MKKVSCASQTTDAITLPADCCAFVSAARLSWLRNLVVESGVVHCYMPIQKVLWTNLYAKLNIHLIPLRCQLFPVTYPKQLCACFWWGHYRFWATGAFGIIDIYTAAFKDSNHLSRWSRFQITLIKISFSLNQVFSHRKSMINQQKKIFSIYCFENNKTCAIKTTVMC